MKSQAVEQLLPFVLYFGSTPLDSIKQVSNPAFSIRFVENNEEFKNAIVDPLCYSVIISSSENLKVTQSLSLCKILNSAVARIVLLNNSTNEEVLEYYNSFEVFKVYDSGLTEEHLKKDLIRALLYFQNNQSQQKLVSEIKKQNAELEELTTGLEKIVEVRTEDELIAKKAIELQVANMRAVNRFLRDLSSVLAIEEILIILRREIKSYHKVVSPVLIIQQTNATSKIYYFHGANIHVSDIQGEIEFFKDVAYDQQSHKLFLANNLGRPLGQLVSVPVKCEIGQGLLFFENSMKGQYLEEFVSFVKERIQFIEITLDRVMLDQEMRRASFLWEKTFNGIDEPICIVNDEFKLLKKNKYFGGEAVTCHQALTGSNTACEGCPLDSSSESGDVFINNKHYRVQSYFLFEEKSVKTFVNHYVDMTKYEELHSKILQNEKLSAVGHVADHIAHELNNPLTGICALAQVLIEEVNDSDTLCSDLKEVEGAALRCQKIIKNLINFSKQSGEVKAEAISLSSIVKSTLPLLKTALTNFEQDFHLSDEESDLINVEPQLIQQVIFNIINNACQSMGDSGCVHINIDSQTLDGKPFVKLSIEDDGSGISTENIQSIFDPFFTTKQKGEGTGLGLSVCKQIIESYGGYIQVESQQAKGAKFSLFIPSYSPSA